MPALSAQDKQGHLSAIHTRSRVQIHLLPLSFPHRDHEYQHPLILHLVNQPITRPTQLDLVAVRQPMQAVGLDPRSLQYLCELLFELLAHGITQLLPLLSTLVDRTQAQRSSSDTLIPFWGLASRSRTRASSASSSSVTTVVRNGNRSWEATYSRVCRSSSEGVTPSFSRTAYERVLRSSSMRRLIVPIAIHQVIAFVITQ
uniref:RelB/E n=1 Tax=Aeromonas hydrophila TaxID=644 RepID=G9GAX6_AERHY|nr:relB/E [Aeromonas hydrophila]